MCVWVFKQRGVGCLKCLRCLARSRSLARWSRGCPFTDGTRVHARTRGETHLADEDGEDGHDGERGHGPREGNESRSLHRQQPWGWVLVVVVGGGVRVIRKRNGSVYRRHVSHHNQLHTPNPPPKNTRSPFLHSQFLKRKTAPASHAPAMKKVLSPISDTNTNEKAWRNPEAASFVMTEL